MLYLAVLLSIVFVSMIIVLALLGLTMMWTTIFHPSKTATVEIVVRWSNFWSNNFGLWIWADVVQEEMIPLFVD